MRAVFVNASPGLAAIAERLHRPGEGELVVNRDPNVTPEPLQADHPLTRVPNVTLSAHSAFRTPEASDNLIQAALEHCRRIAADIG